jgi:hypothetical protein
MVNKSWARGAPHESPRASIQQAFRMSPAERSQKVENPLLGRVRRLKGDESLRYRSKGRRLDVARVATRLAVPRPP